MLVQKGVRVGTEYGDGIVVAVTKEWVIVDVGGSAGEVALHKQDSPVWLAPASYENSGVDEAFELKGDA